MDLKKVTRSPLLLLATVARLNVSTSDRYLPTITDSAAIGRVLAHLADVDAGWEPATENLPPVPFSADFMSTDNTVVLAVWVGEDWIAAKNPQDGESYYMRQAFVSPRRGPLLGSLGISPEESVPEAVD